MQSPAAPASRASRMWVLGIMSRNRETRRFPSRSPCPRIRGRRVVDVMQRVVDVLLDIVEDFAIAVAAVVLEPRHNPRDGLALLLEPSSGEPTRFIARG